MAGRVLLFAILVFYILYPRPGEGADAAVEEKIKSIRQRYAEVERGLKQCRQVKRALSGESAESGKLIARELLAAAKRFAARMKDGS